MARRVDRIERTDLDGRTTRTTEVADGEVVAPRAAGPVLVAGIIWFITGVVLAILAIRFVLALLGANPGNAFANFIYTISHPMVAPFFSLFSYRQQYGVSRFEVYTLVAMIVYALAGYILARLFTLTRPAGNY